jgi:hypothetical protein
MHQIENTAFPYGLKPPECLKPLAKRGRQEVLDILAPGQIRKKVVGIIPGILIPYLAFAMFRAEFTHVLSYLFLIEKIPFRISSSHGMPCRKKSNQSIGLTSRPFISIWIFSQICGGLKGASPSVRHSKITTVHDNWDINFSTMKLYHRPHFCPSVVFLSGCSQNSTMTVTESL